MQWIIENWIVLLIIGGLAGLYVYSYRSHRGQKGGEKKNGTAAGGCCGGHGECQNDESHDCDKGHAKESPQDSPAAGVSGGDPKSPRIPTQFRDRADASGNVHNK